MAIDYALIHLRNISDDLLPTEVGQLSTYLQHKDERLKALNASVSLDTLLIKILNF